jgi:nucleotide-binding universal stress UspA family protein
MGSHGHTAFYDLLVGSTTQGVLKKAPCPVLIVPAEKAKRRKI